MWFVSRWRLLNALGNTKRLPIAVFIFACLFGIDSIAARIQLRLLQSDIVVETKTHDNVFVMMNVGLSTVSMSRAWQMPTINLCVQNLRLNLILKTPRSSGSKINLDELSEKKMRLPWGSTSSEQKKWQLTATLSETLITKVEPDAKLSNPWMKSMQRNVNGLQRKN